jgi:hypothetical protein
MQNELPNEPHTDMPKVRWRMRSQAGISNALQRIAAGAREIEAEAQKIE